MSVITLFSGIFCNDTAVIGHVMESTGHSLINDEMIIASASELSGIPPAKIQRAFSSQPSVFNQFTHEKESSIAYLRLAAARTLSRGPVLISGYTGLLIPQTIKHALRVCLIADMDSRIARAKTAFQMNEPQKKQAGPDEQAAARMIHLDDHDRSVWTDTLFSIKDPWNPGLYDMVLPMGEMEPAKAAALIQENLLKEPLRQTEDSAVVVNDFLLAAGIETALADAGHHVNVRAQKGRITLTIDKQVLMLGRLEDELKSIVTKVPGVTSVEVLVEQVSLPSGIYRKRSGELPSKVLLVDDEREFVQTLSERLQMRDMGSVVAFDGKSALDLIQSDEPDVMIIDLKMPGIDGMTVLKQAKQTRPGIEVIVLTGHGSEQDRKTCMGLGAFAYMQKPVDINLLSDTLKKAHEKVKKI
jgi:CheY-like chemotaxis protein